MPQKTDYLAEPYVLLNVPISSVLVTESVEHNGKWVKI